MTDDLTTSQHDGPVDERSASRLAERGLRLARLRNEVPSEFEPWLQALRRGFLDVELNEVSRDAAFERLGYRRLIAVLDDAGPEPAVPVGTFASWVGRLSVPGGELPSCAISSVTVSPTHRRRGIARAMMEGELRRAAALDLPIASLTVSESTLYGRYGFGAAVSVASLELDVKRASWIGPVAPGRIDFISRERWRAAAPELFDRVRVGRPGEFEMPGGHWDRAAGTRPDAEKAGAIRALQYTDEAGVVRGLALYTVTENLVDFTKSTVDIGTLIVDGDDAYAALWRFFVELDLIQTVRANELAIDEPLLWMISDRRAAVVTVRDHHYVRVLDVAAVLQSRVYAAPGCFELHIDDPLGFCDGTYTLRVDGSGAAEVTSGAADDAVRVEIGAAELAAISLGQVSALTLARAGRLRSADAGALARTFSWPDAVRLSHWY